MYHEIPIQTFTEMSTANKRKRNRFLNFVKDVFKLSRICIRSLNIILFELLMFDTFYLKKKNNFCGPYTKIYLYIYTQRI